MRYVNIFCHYSLPCILHQEADILFLINLLHYWLPRKQKLNLNPWLLRKKPESNKFYLIFVFSDHFFHFKHRKTLVIKLEELTEHNALESCPFSLFLLFKVKSFDVNGFHPSTCFKNKIGSFSDTRKQGPGEATFVFGSSP